MAYFYQPYPKWVTNADGETILVASADEHEIMRKRGFDDPEYIEPKKEGEDALRNEEGKREEAAEEVASTDPVESDDDDALDDGAPETEKPKRRGRPPKKEN